MMNQRREFGRKVREQDFDKRLSEGMVDLLFGCVLWLRPCPHAEFFSPPLSPFLDFFSSFVFLF